MIPVVTVSQMRAIDEGSIGNNPAVGYSYMLKAGMGLFAAAKEFIGDPASGEIAVVCGKGNNGGDGYVAARLLLEEGYRVMCFSLCAAEELKGEARLALDEYTERKGNYLVLSDASDLPDLSRFRLIIDAMLGTGAKGDPRGLCAVAIEAINGSGSPVLAADTPSGLSGDTGVPGIPCIRATATVTMGFPKVGQFFYPGRTNVGTLTVQELGYPDEIVEKVKPSLFLPSPAKLRRMLPSRKPAGSKFDHGLALLLCGSKGMTGSATLAATAALRTGCGMTHLAIAESAVPVVSAKLTETVIHPLRETASGTPSASSLPEIMVLAESMQAICIGPGISHEEETGAMIRELVSKCFLPAVLDADGINAYKGRAGDLSSHRGELLLTPHRGEWRRLFGEPPQEPSALIAELKKKAAEFRITILLKGNPTVVATPGAKAYMLPFGNSALAKAGSGDVLSGIIVSLLAQGAPCEDAAILGAYLHAEAGVMASREFGEYSVIPTDVVNTIHRAIRTLLGNGCEEPLVVPRHAGRNQNAA